MKLINVCGDDKHHESLKRKGVFFALILFSSMFSLMWSRGDFSILNSLILLAVAILCGFIWVSATCWLGKKIEPFKKRKQNEDD